jgi:hypothetical protein
MKHDAIRAADVSRTGGGSDSAHRLRTLSVEKGLLRAVGNAQKVCGRVLECSVSGACQRPGPAAR